MAQTLPVPLMTEQPEKCPKPGSSSQYPDNDYLPKFVGKDRILPPLLPLQETSSRALGVHISPDIFYPPSPCGIYYLTRYHQRYIYTVERIHPILEEKHEPLTSPSAVQSRPDNDHKLVENTLPSLQDEERIRAKVLLADLQECIDAKVITSMRFEQSRQQVICSSNQLRSPPLSLPTPPVPPVDIESPIPTVEPKKTRPNQPPPAARTQLMTRPVSHGTFRYYNPIGHIINDAEERRRRVERRRGQNRHASRQFRERKRLANQRKDERLAYLESICAQLTNQLEMVLSQDFPRPKMVDLCLPESQLAPLMSPPSTSHQDSSPTERGCLGYSPYNLSGHGYSCRLPQ
ncbi:hypothetical protein IWQ61_002936 [Dispira simplex]|nr:hypothetical protein IWQ61_002936 [Dispira simplex]